MATFAYEAVDSQGKEVQAEVEAGSEAEASNKIRALNQHPVKVWTKGQRRESSRRTAAVVDSPVRTLADVRIGGR